MKGWSSRDKLEVCANSRGSQWDNLRSPAFFFSRLLFPPFFLLSFFLSSFLHSTKKPRCTFSLLLGNLTRPPARVGHFQPPTVGQQGLNYAFSFCNSQQLPFRLLLSSLPHLASSKSLSHVGHCLGNFCLQSHTPRGTEPGLHFQRFAIRTPSGLKALLD